MAGICWQPSVSLPLQIGSPARVPSDCITIHAAALPRGMRPSQVSKVPWARRAAGVTAYRLPTRAMLGFQLNWLCHAFEPCSRVSRPGFEVSPPSALEDKHTAAAFTSSSISGFAEWFNSEHHSQPEGYEPPPQSNPTRSHSLVHIKTYALERK